MKLSIPILESAFDRQQKTTYDLPPQLLKFHQQGPNRWDLNLVLSLTVTSDHSG